MRSVWGIHMPKTVGDAPVRDGYACIGWPTMGDIFAIPNDRDAYKTKLREAYPDKKLGAIPVEAGTVFRFAQEVAVGDVMVFPSKHDRLVNIGEVTGKSWHDPGNEHVGEDYPNFLGVDWKVAVPRETFSQSALYEIGSFITLFKIRSHASEFLSALDSCGEVAVAIEDESVPDDVATQNAVRLAEESTLDFVVRRLASELSGYEFEEFIAHLLECMGYTARVTEKSSDGGVDVVAHSDELGFVPPIIKVQCKRQTSQIGEPDVHQLLGTLGEGEFGLFVTLGSYSRPARVRERTAPRLRLIDGEMLVQLILERYADLSARYRTMLPLRKTYIPDLFAE